MGITGLGHIYAETNDWESSASFWRGLGFEFAERWGSDGHRAGRLQSGSASVVIAEVEGEPQFTVFFALEGGDAFSMGPGITVDTPLEDTHWGTRWIRVRDADGRVHALEEEAAS
ncbi:MAG: VOC family protein [Acidimicrobiia bacterium]|nr:VOC family protein [Acidimicrobiia bacterium]NNC76111.1 VOC family protein [Acidimicrobiia bacterium]